MNDTKAVITQWFDFFAKADFDSMFGLMDEDIKWENCIKIEGVTDVVPHLGVYHGKKDVVEMFGVFGKHSTMNSFKKDYTLIEGDLAVIHVFEQNTALSTNQAYTADVIFEMHVAGGKVVSMKTYWDTASAVSAFKAKPAGKPKTIYYVQMKWNYQGNMTQEQLWLREMEEAAFATGPEGDKYIQVLSIYKVASQPRIVAIVEAESADDLDRHTMFGLPMGDILEFEHVWALRDYGAFIGDVFNRNELFETRRKNQEDGAV